MACLVRVTWNLTRFRAKITTFYRHSNNISLRQFVSIICRMSLHAASSLNSLMIDRQPDTRLIITNLSNLWICSWLYDKRLCDRSRAKSDKVCSKAFTSISAFFVLQRINSYRHWYQQHYSQLSHYLSQDWTHNILPKNFHIWHIYAVGN